MTGKETILTMEEKILIVEDAAPRLLRTANFLNFLTPITAGTESLLPNQEHL
jgi:hypothetical protein